MALIIFPLNDYDSFSTLADAELIVSNMVGDNTSWTGLTDPQKEAYLRQSTLLIRNKIDLPSDLESDLKLGCVHLSVHSIGLDMLNSDGKDNIKRKSIDGAVETEFFTKGQRSNAFPSIVNTLLSQYGLTTDGTFRLERA